MWAYENYCFMNLFFILNIVLFVSLSIYTPFYISKQLKLPILNPITIASIIIIPVDLFKSIFGPAFLLPDGLFDKYYNFAILMTNLNCIITLFVISFAFKVFRSYDSIISYWYNSIKPRWRVKRRKMLLASFFMLIIFFISFIALSSNSFGVINWIQSPRTGYQFHRTGAGQYYALALLFLSSSFSICLLYIKKTINILLILGIYLILAFLLGSKMILLHFCIYVLIIFWFRGKKNLAKVIIKAMPLIFILLLLNFGSFSLEDIATYFDYYVNSAHYYEEYFNGNMPLFYGEVSYSQIWGLVPRSLYPDKPYVYGITLVNEIMFPGAAEASHTPAFGGPLHSFADFGILGVVFDSLFNFVLFFNMLCYYFIFKNRQIDCIRNNPILLYLVLLMFAPCFMQFFQFPLSLILFVVLTKIVSVTNRAIVKC